LHGAAGSTLAPRVKEIISPDRRAFIARNAEINFALRATPSGNVFSAPTSQRLDLRFICALLIGFCAAQRS
jgi:hypothetical protein